MVLATMLSSWFLTKHRLTRTCREFTLLMPSLFKRPLINASIPSAWPEFPGLN
jgi:hypothetical protein